MIISNLEQLSNWQQPGNVGDSGGGSPKTPGTGVIIPGSPAAVYVVPAYAYNNFYFLLAGIIPSAQVALQTYLAQAISFSFQTAQDIANCQALEFEMQAGVAGEIYNCAWQADIAGTKTWRIFDYAAQEWISSGLPLPGIVPQIPLIAKSSFVRTAAATTHVGLLANGKFNPVNFVRPPVKMTTVVPDYLNFAFQIDTIAGSPPPAFRVDVGGMSATLLASS